MKITVLRFVSLCSLAEIDQRFRNGYCFQHHGDDELTEAVSNSETWRSFYETTWRSIPEEKSSSCTVNWNEWQRNQSVLDYSRR
jgi:hypothetical protein